ncbi:Very short patch repair protein [Enhygromyxa salina]|uniref:Very short patch repair protein n=1 Tax=Enhygromyxa salina TaxID=215803 RepID=A0A2S9XJV3_9BACT|nr:very short patch repair endonuclease [Enhygromyxa salina]PRP93145.1 Very short patch repair protein [Enhygromyxa salina]
MAKKYAKPKPLSTSVRDGFTLEVDPETSRRMAGIRQKGTKPELIVRRILRRLGIHYRLANRDLPGSPDLANRRRKWALFVHGCFWHRHPGCRLTTTPTRNREFWLAKFERNQERDRQRAAELRERGIEVVTVWECETRDPETLATRLLSELGQR